MKTYGPHKGRNNVYFWYDEDELEDLEDILDRDTKETEVTVENIHWKDAYEANKTRDTCIICGNDTVNKTIFSSTIKYCPCVDELAKKG